MCPSAQGLPSTLRLHQPGSRAAPLVSSGRRVLPALGLAWANCVNTRLFAARHEGWGGGVIRSLQVGLCNEAGEGRASVQGRGVCLLVARGGDKVRAGGLVGD